MNGNDISFQYAIKSDNSQYIYLKMVANKLGMSKSKKRKTIFKIYQAIELANSFMIESLRIAMVNHL